MANFSSNRFIRAKLDPLVYTSNNYIQSNFVSNNYLEDIKSTFGSGDVTNNYLVATFTSNNYVQNLLGTSFTSNNYIQGQLDLKATNTYVNSTFTSNNYVNGRFTSNSFVKATFTSNNYVDGRFTSNNFVKAVFTSNNYVDNQLSTRIGIRATNTYVQSTFTSNSFAVDTFSSNAYMRDHVATEVAAIVNSAPAALDTLNELAAALGDDPNFATTVSNQIGIRATNTYVNSTFTSNSYVDDQLNARIGIRATNTYVNSTFTSNNYVDGRFASNNYVKAVFSSNNYNQATYGSNNYNAATYPSISGTPVDNQIAVWTGASTLEGDTNFQWTGTQLQLNASADEGRRIEIGSGRTGNGYAYIDFIGDATYSDYGLRIIRNNSGPNTTSVLNHRGTGALQFQTQDAADLKLRTNNTDRLTITSGGNVGIGTTSPDSIVHVSFTDGSGNGKLIFEDATLPRQNYFGVEGHDNVVIAADEDNLGGSSSIRFRVDATQRASIDASGNFDADGTIQDSQGNVRALERTAINSTPYNFQSGSSGKYFSTNVGSLVINIDAADIEMGDIFTIWNYPGYGDVTISWTNMTNGVYIAGDTQNKGTSGSITLAPAGLCTVICDTGSRMVFSGNVI